MIIEIGIVLLSTVSHGDDYTREQYWDDRVCFVETDQNRTIAILDTWDYVSEPTVGVGTTSWEIEFCLPFACPEGFTMVSAVCWESDPFEHIPYEEPVETFVVEEEPLINIGPLIEPSIYLP